MRLFPRRGVAGLTLAAACFLMSDARFGLAQPNVASVPLSDADFGKLVDHTRVLIQDAIKDTKPQANAVKRATIAAQLLAAIAQASQTADNAKNRAAIRGTAFRIVEALDLDKWEQARAEQQKLTANATDDKAAIAPLPIMDKKINLSNVMHHYATGQGGAGGEKQLTKLESQAVKGKLPAKAMTDDVIVLALKSAVVGEMIKESTHNKPKKDPKAWKKYADEMRRYSLELADATRAKNGEKALVALGNLNASCSACHEKFGK